MDEPERGEAGGGVAGAGARGERPRGEPERVRVHDFKDEALGKAVPYGVCDLSADAGWVSVGVDHDTISPTGNPINRLFTLSRVLKGRLFWRIRGVGGSDRR